MADGEGPIGYLYHRSSGKCVHPLGGSSNPGNNTKLVLFEGNGGPGRLQVRFVPVEGFGHYGYIRHVSSGKTVAPLGGSLTPGNNTKLVYHSDHHAACLFAFDEDDERIVHRDGKNWGPLGGAPAPGNNTPCVLHADVHDATKFYFGSLDGSKISAYPTANLSGTWKVVKAFIDPKTTHTFTQDYKVGKTLKTSTTEHHAWSVSATVAYGIFSASAEYSSFVENTSENTWSTECGAKTTINVVAGKTIVVWQFVFGMKQYDEEYSFQSNIIGDSYSLDVKPSI